MPSREYPERPILGVGVVVLDGEALERVLLVRRGRAPSLGQWSVPGGTVHVGETLAEAAARELAEETGVAAEIGDVVEVLDRVTRDDAGRVRWHYVIVDFVATAPVGEPRAADDAAEARWVAIADVPSLATTEGLLAVIEKARQLARG